MSDQVDIANRVATSSIALVRAGVEQLRYHADAMHTDPASIERVIREAELLSSTLKRLEPFLDTPEAKVERVADRPKIDLEAVSRALKATVAGHYCTCCGKLKIPESES